MARAEIALHAEPAESAVEWAQRSLEIARRTRRRKYEARSSTLLGEAFARLGRREAALEALRAAVPIADVIGPPGRWQARAALAGAAASLGEDDVASDSYEEAATLIEEFAATLAPERSSRLLAAPPIEQILSAAGRSLTPGR